MNFINNSGLPFCKGCGHTLIAQNTEKALVKLGKNPLDVILVTDIGCHGIIDKSFDTHTVHGLHGRSVALAAGVSAGANDPSKKVIVFIGDGGATIGMQHIIDAAHNGFNMTVVIHNNMLYGMTGGQPSEFTPTGFKTPVAPEGATKEGYNICEIVASAGAGYVSRVTGIGDFSDELAKAFSCKGFSLVEVMEICPSYGMKANPGMKLSQVIADAGIELKIFADRGVSDYHIEVKNNQTSLIVEEDVIAPAFENNLTENVRIMLCGSAGEGIQSNAELLIEAAVRSGLCVTKKGSYPVTVGIGFSAAEVIISPEHIKFTGTVIPDIMIITSQDGLEYGRSAAKKMTSGKIYLDSSLSDPETGAEIIRYNFREKAGARTAGLMATFYYLFDSKIFDKEAMVSVFKATRIAEKVIIENLLDFDLV